MRPSITSHKKSLQQGFTLLESLVGIVVIGLVLAVMAPPLLLVTATRVQHQRAEQAMQLAQAQIDQVRLLMSQGQNQLSYLPPVTVDPISNIAAPTVTSAIPACTGITVSTCFVTVNGDKFLVQIFRNQGFPPNPGSNDSIIAFRMGVRVYGPQVFNTSNLGQTLQQSSASLSLTSLQNLNPSVVIFTEISKHDTGTSLNAYKNLINTSNSN